MSEDIAEIAWRQACRACGSTKTRVELDAGGYVNCCPERTANDLIERQTAAHLLARENGGAK